MIALRELAQPAVSGTTYTYQFPPISQGQAANVTVSVPGAPATARWTVYAGALPVGTLIGANAMIGLYLGGGESASLTGTSASDPGQASEVGVLGSASEVPVTAPTPSPGATNIGAEVNISGDVTVSAITGTVDVSVQNATIPVSGSVDANITNATLTVAGTVDIAAGQVVEVTNESGGSLTVAGTVDATVANATIESGTVDISAIGTGGSLLAGDIAYTTTSVNITPPVGTGTLVITNISSTVTVSVIDLTTPTFLLPVRSVSNSHNAVLVPTSTWYVDVPVGGVELTVTLSGDNTSGGAGLGWSIYANTGVAEVMAVPPTVPAQVVSLVNPSAGLNWSYTLPFAARIAHIGATYLCDSTTGDRYPYVSLGIGQGAGADALPANTPLTAGDGVNLSWVAGALVVPFFSQGVNTFRATLAADVVLPAGQVITGGVGGYQGPGDQWEDINLALVPA